MSRWCGNAIREALVAAGIIERVAFATRSGQVVLYQLTNFGRTVCSSIGVEPGMKLRKSLEHRFQVNRMTKYFEKKGCDVTYEHSVKSKDAIDILARKPSEQVAIKIETSKSNIERNLKNITKANFDQSVLATTTGNAVATCKRAIDSIRERDARKLNCLAGWISCKRATYYIS